MQILYNHSALDSPAFIFNSEIVLNVEKFFSMFTLEKVIIVTHELQLYGHKKKIKPKKSGVNLGLLKTDLTSFKQILFRHTLKLELLPSISSCSKVVFSDLKAVYTCAIEN